MEIQILPKDFGGTEFLAEPYRLHLGGQNSQGVDRLTFHLPDRWKQLDVTLHIRHCDGSLSTPIPLDNAASVPVGRSFTGWESGQWMLCATDGSGYTAFTRPGRYDVYAVLPTDGNADEPEPSAYEAFVAQVLANAKAAAASCTKAENAANRAENAAGQLSGILTDPLQNIVLRPYSALSGPDALTATGATLTRLGSSVSLTGNISTYASWSLPSGLTADDAFRISGSCTALSGGMKVILNAFTKSDPAETEYYPLLNLTANTDFNFLLDLGWYAANTNIDLTKPMDIRFLFTSASSSATLKQPTLSKRLCSCSFINENGSTLGEVLQAIEKEIKKHHPGNS